MSKVIDKYVINKIERLESEYKYIETRIRSITEERDVYRTQLDELIDLFTTHTGSDGTVYYKTKESLIGERDEGYKLIKQLLEEREEIIPF